MVNVFKTLRTHACMYACTCYMVHMEFLASNVKQNWQKLYKPCTSKKLYKNKEQQKDKTSQHKIHSTLVENSKIN